MGAKTQHHTEYYVWEVRGKPVVVHLHLDVVDRLVVEVMRGFGAVPKRGAEVGGILIGTIEEGDPAIVRVEDFEPIQCAYKRGPSYLFVEEDALAFEDACENWRQDGSRDAYAIGYFRSHTRDGLALAPEDVELLDRHFPAAANIALLVKPYGTKVSTAGFFAREDGVFPETSPLEFPFRRNELAGEEAPPRRSLFERGPRARESRSLRPTHIPEPAFSDDDLDSSSIPQAGPAYAVTAPSKSRVRGGWVWIPLSVIFLLLGVLLGFQAALTIGSRGSSGGAQDFSLGLAVSKSDENLSVKWDRQAPAVKAASRGVLEIEDGSYAKSVDLDTAQLQNGNIIYRNSSNTVKFRLVVYPKSRLSVAETMEWRR